MRSDLMGIILQFAVLDPRKIFHKRVKYTSILTKSLDFNHEIAIKFTTIYNNQKFKEANEEVI